MNPMAIEYRKIGSDQPVFVIAEIGVNHDGSLKRAVELVQHAAEAGADAVKFQIFRAQRLMHGSAALAEYQKDRVPESDPAAMLNKYELTGAELRNLVTLARRLGLVPLATPFSPDDVATIESLELHAIKIASPDLVNRPLLSRAAAAGVPIILSTGAATLAEIETCVSWLREWETRFALLHCVSSYPTPPQQANLCWIAELARRFDVPVGYSDHTTHLLAGACAVAVGAVVVEKHLTYDKNAQGPDHAASADPTEFADFVRLIRAAEKLRGIGPKRVLEIENDVRSVSRQSLVIARDLCAGDVIREDDLTVQRPGTGIAASEVQVAVGRRARQALRAGTLLQWDMLSDAA
jgi:sialic acid synthase SpsE